MLFSFNFDSIIVDLRINCDSTALPVGSDHVIDHVFRTDSSSSNSKTINLIQLADDSNWSIHST